MDQPRKPTRIISIDTETTGLDHNRHQMLSLGMVDLKTLDEFYVEVEHKEILLSIEALRINKFDLVKENTKPSRAAQLIYQWLCAHGLGKYDLRAMGFQAHWDRLIVEKFVRDNLQDKVALDEHKNLFIHRVVDLNSIMAFLAETRHLDPHDFRDRIEKRAEVIFKLRNDFDFRSGQHCAIHDAKWNLCCWDICSEAYDLS